MPGGLGGRIHEGIILRRGLGFSMRRHYKFMRLLLVWETSKDSSWYFTHD